MRTIYKMLLACLVCLSFISCEFLPDLNPFTNAGADIAVVEIGDTIRADMDTGLVYSPIGNEYPEFSVIVEASKKASITMFGKTFQDKGSYPYQPGLPLTPMHSAFVKYLTYDQMSGSLIPNSIWVDPGYGVPYSGGGLYLFNCNTGPCISVAPMPSGLRYVAIQNKIGDDYHYGWIELIMSVNVNDLGHSYFVNNRFAIAEDPGIVLRMGQTN